MLFLFQTLFCLCLGNLLVRCVSLSVVSLYDVLEISKTSTSSEIKKAFRKMSLIYHPDKYNGMEADANEKFNKIQEAYNVLSDPHAKILYDYHWKLDRAEFSQLQEYAKEMKDEGMSDIYLHKKNVRVLFDKNIENVIAESQYVWIVKFYHPRCGHCHTVAPEVVKAAKTATTDEKARVGTVNCGKSWFLCRRFGIQSYPTVLFFLPKNRRVNRGSKQVKWS
eukprot:Platyproteum_vivax@DN6123_c0_g1_i1.p1